jgi:hypothetical protein
MELRSLLRPARRIMCVACLVLAVHFTHWSLISTPRATAAPAVTSAKGSQQTSDESVPSDEEPWWKWLIGSISSVSLGAVEFDRSRVSAVTFWLLCAAAYGSQWFPQATSWALSARKKRNADAASLSQTSGPATNIDSHQELSAANSLAVVHDANSEHQLHSETSAAVQVSTIFNLDRTTLGCVPPAPHNGLSRNGNPLGVVLRCMEHKQRECDIHDVQKAVDSQCRRVRAILSRFTEETDCRKYAPATLTEFGLYCAELESFWSDRDIRRFASAVETFNRFFQHFKSFKDEMEKSHKRLRQLCESDDMELRGSKRRTKGRSAVSGTASDKKYVAELNNKYVEQFSDIRGRLDDAAALLLDASDQLARIEIEHRSNSPLHSGEGRSVEELGKTNSASQAGDQEHD